MSSNSSSSTNTIPINENPDLVTQNIANFVSLHLSSTNFLLWKTQMLNILESYDLQGFVTGETQPPPQLIAKRDFEPQQNTTFLQWSKTDRLVKKWLVATLSEVVLGIVVGLTTAIEVWHALVHAFALKQRLTSITHVSNTLGVYLRHFKTICDELAVIGKLVPDHEKFRWILNGPSKDYEVLTTTLLPLPITSYSEVVTLLESYTN